MKNRVLLILMMLLTLGGCDYIYAKDEVAQMTAELSRLSGQNSALVEEITRMETEMATLRETVGLQGGAVLASTAVTDPIQQVVLADLPRQTALIPVNEDGAGLLYAISTAVFFGDNHVYVYAQGERVGVDMILSYAVKADGLNTVEWVAELYNLGEGWIPIEPNTPVKTITTDTSSPNGNTITSGETSAGETSAEEGAASSIASAVEETSSSASSASQENNGNSVSQELPAIEATNPAESGMRDAYLQILDQAG